MIFARKVSVLALVMGMLLILTAASCTHLSQPAPSPAATPVPTDKVLVKNSSFDPARILIAAGTSVTWTNQDPISYFVTDNNDTFAFNLSPGGSFSVSFAEVGTYHYHCAIHPYLQGTIIVAPGAYANHLRNGNTLVTELAESQILPVSSNKGTVNP